MEHIKIFLKPVLVVVFILTVFSCKNNKSEKEEEPKIMEEAEMAMPEFIPFKVITIKHKVANYERWRKEYDAHDSIRQTYGITHYVLGRGMDDPNVIVVIDKFNDVQKAKEFSKLPALKEVMKKAGVIGAPEFSYYDVIRNDGATINLKDRLMVTHRVKDFDAWLKVYDAEGINKRSEEGLIDRGMARSVDDPNVVALVFAISDMEKAKASITSEEKKKLMIEAGVEGVPQFFYYKLED
jgi:quinol monooxygenase YgiN